MRYTFLLLWNFNSPITCPKYGLAFFTSLFNFSCFFIFSKKTTAAFTVLCIAAGFSAEGDILCSIPRGFSPGLFLCSGIALSILKPNALPLHMLNALISSFGVTLNPNAWLVYCVLWTVFVLQNLHMKRRLLLLALTLLCSLFLADVLFNRFYKLHPHYVVYGLTNDWNLKHFSRALSHITDYVTAFGPFNSGALCISLLVLFITYRFYKYSPKFILAGLVLIVLLALSLCNGKLQEGSTWPYYSYCRFFLPVPFILAACSYILPQSKRIVVVISCFMVLFLVYKSLQFKTLISKLENPKSWIGVHLIPTPKTKEAIQVYSNYCKRYSCDTFLVSNGFWLNTVLAYGGKALHAEFPVCTESRSERRYWVRERLNKQKPKRLLCLSANTQLDHILKSGQTFKIHRIDDYGLYLIEQNYLTIAQWSSYLNTLE